jgi:hypothetical protein
MTNRKFLSCSVLSLLILVLLPQLSGRQNLQAQEKRFHFKIDPKTPVKDLLPVVPKATSSGGPVLDLDLTKIPEVHFEEPLSIQTRRPDLSQKTKNLSKEEIALLQKMEEEKENLLKQTAHQIAKINFLNKDHPDRFLRYLLRDRPDLVGLPFVMGDACRLDKERGSLFHEAVRDARPFVGGPRQHIILGPWDLETYFGDNHDKKNPARIAAMMQMVTPDRVAMRVGLARFFGHLKEHEATLALIKLALYADEIEVRSAALKALEKHADHDIKDSLLKGLTYPWPPIAENAAQAIVHLKRTDLVPDLVNFLGEPDPRLPVTREIKGQKVPVVRELVRINHHRNCLLCHPPGNTRDVTRDVLIAELPVPGESFSPSAYGGLRSPDILVRADVTYLRQDFSRLQEVPDADPWPKMQRFDFLVRTRILTEDEAKKYQAEFAKVEKNSPYRQAALSVLRALTGRDAAPTAAAWRKVLALPPQ